MALDGGCVFQQSAVCLHHGFVEHFCRRLERNLCPTRVIFLRTNILTSRLFNRIMATSSSGKTLPKVLVFDLDGCVWYPEMYQLYGGKPFTVKDDGNLKDRNGELVYLMKDVKSIMHELKTSEKWKDSQVAVASCCDEPVWADECINKFPIGDGHKLKDIFGHKEIYKGSKAGHLKTIASKTGVALKDMIFFDNEYGNCRTVAGIGVTVLYTPDGVTRKGFEEAIDKFPAPGEILGPKKKYGW